MDQTRGTTPIIEDPLKWQEEINRIGIGMNMRGAGRFWTTVQHLLGHNVAYDATPPPFGELLIQLTDTIGLLVTANVAWDAVDVKDSDGTLNVEFVRILPNGPSWRKFERVGVDEDATQ
jgi:hypothetical protein